MQHVGAGFITTDADVETLVFDWGTARILSEPQVTGARRHSFGITEVLPGGGHGRHNHPGTEEIIYVLSGEGEQMVDDQPPVKIGPGACIFIPDGIYHATLNTGSERMRLLIVYAPTGAERLLRDIPGCRVLPPGEIPQTDRQPDA
jgi:oxalate decarboxylase/phosphoglucose isomerase-like protein (cupin superfamily)